MLSQTLTMVDLVKITGRSRYELRGLIEGALAKRSKKGARFAREFTRQEFLTLVTMAHVEGRYGIRRSCVVSVSSMLGEVLNGPREANPDAWLVVRFSPPEVTYVTQRVPVEDALVIYMRPIFERVDRYVSKGELPAAQPHLPFKPQQLARPKKAQRG